MDKLINKLFPHPLPSTIEIETRYPPRDLKPEQRVSRQGPSPTGFMHIGTVYAGLITERFTHQSSGVFFLRIEDTDTKREVKEATALIVKSLETYGLKPDEGVDENGISYGAYGPYIQSQRKEIYQAYVKRLVMEGKAYPCFATTEELDEMRKQQEKEGLRPGYYGKWAKYRNLTEEQIEEKLNQGLPYIFRFKSPGDYEKKIAIKDVLRGETIFPENDIDVVIMKSDGLPTYHFAHVIDDHLMGTTHVIRADEWYASLPLHIQLFRAMGWKPPKYCHIAPIQKMDGTSRRKLSKRKDPEATAGYYAEEGYPKAGVLEYLMNLANSSFEDWRKQNPQKQMNEFPFDITKMNKSGALFDFVKLASVSREVIARMSTDEVFNQALAWANQYDKDLAGMMNQDVTYTKQIIGIERENTKSVRKDIAKWNEVKSTMEYFFDDRFKPVNLAAMSEAYGQKVPITVAGNNNLTAPEFINCFNDFMNTYSEKDDKDTWFAKMKETTAKHGYATDGKAYKENPSAFKGNMADFAKIFRILLTGKPESPDLYSIMQVMGKERMLKRGKSACASE